MNQNSSKLTAEQHEVLYGILLGDASLKTQTGGNLYALHIEQSMEARGKSPDKSPYVLHLYDMFHSWVNPNTPPAVITAEKGQKLAFTTLVQDSLRYYAHQFYRPATDEEKRLHEQTGSKNKLHYKKKVPDDIHKHLTDRTLAYWYMDDGALKRPARAGKTLSTHGFTKAEVERLSAALLSIGIQANVNKETRKVHGAEKTYYKLYITTSSDPVFTEKIRPYVLSVFKYKLDAKTRPKDKQANAKAKQAKRANMYQQEET